MRSNGGGWGEYPGRPPTGLGTPVNCGAAARRRAPITTTERNARVPYLETQHSGQARGRFPVDPVQETPATAAVAAVAALRGRFALPPQPAPQEVGPLFQVRIVVGDLDRAGRHRWRPGVPVAGRFRNKTEIPEQTGRENGDGGRRRRRRLRGDGAIGRENGTRANNSSSNDNGATR